MSFAHQLARISILTSLFHLCVKKYSWLYGVFVALWGDSTRTCLLYLSKYVRSITHVLYTLVCSLNWNTDSYFAAAKHLTCRMSRLGLGLWSFSCGGGKIFVWNHYWACSVAQRFSFGRNSRRIFSRSDQSLCSLVPRRTTKFVTSFLWVRYSAPFFFSFRRQFAVRLCWSWSLLGNPSRWQNPMAVWEVQVRYN